MIKVLCITQRRVLVSLLRAAFPQLLVYHVGSVTQAEELGSQSVHDVLCVDLFSIVPKEGQWESFGVHRSDSGPAGRSVRPASHGSGFDGLAAMLPILFLVPILLKVELPASAAAERRAAAEALCRTSPERYRVVEAAAGEAPIPQKFLEAVISLVSGSHFRKCALFKEADAGELGCDECAEPHGSLTCLNLAESLLAGRSAAIARVREEICRFAPYPDEVLISGETGTGKEVAASLLHRISGRSGNFVPFNCSAIPRNLAESELFGYIRGAFTDAHRSHPGIFEQSNHGTLFLDEIGDLERNLQPKLLRAVETKRIKRVGSERERELDIRIVSATNAPIDRRSGQSSIRSDLLFRLSTLEIHIPPLRERPEDIIDIAEWYLENRLVSEAGHVLTIDLPGKAILRGYHWPGNVRELFSVLRSSWIETRSSARKTGVRQVLRIRRNRIGTAEKLMITVPEYFDASGAKTGAFLEEER